MRPHCIISRVDIMTQARAGLLMGTLYFSPTSLKPTIQTLISLTTVLVPQLMEPILTDIYISVI